MKQLRAIGLVMAGILSLVIGLAFLPLPPPFFGMVFIAMALVLLTAGSKRARRLIQFLRWRFSIHSKRMEQLLARVPRRLSRHIRLTRPDALHRRGRKEKQKISPDQIDPA
ncbi:hypothetical protein [Thalassospira sp.]|uniref:hypothetical protein n=1 Tax=Thalassospira sp. TaxID=1912094 RepID=UPI002732664D|nr:hypothetical protein [Thalassospira sp.]MDP2698015.1 hypothetical protein [Thalassospira sp.]